jgi:hypothetical protein
VRNVKHSRPPVFHETIRASRTILLATRVSHLQFLVLGVVLSILGCQTSPTELVWRGPRCDHQWDQPDSVTAVGDDPDGAVRAEAAGPHGPRNTARERPGTSLSRKIAGATLVGGLVVGARTARSPLAVAARMQSSVLRPRSPAVSNQIEPRARGRWPG